MIIIMIIMIIISILIFYYYHYYDYHGYHYYSYFYYYHYYHLYHHYFVRSDLLIEVLIFLLYPLILFFEIKTIFVGNVLAVCLLHFFTIDMHFYNL